MGHVTPKRELRSDRVAALMFTQVNAHGISKLDRSLKMTVVASDEVHFGQGTCVVDPVNALKRKHFP